MSVDSKLVKNTQNSFQWFHNAKKHAQAGGKGRGFGVSFSSLNNDANSGMGYNRAAGLAYKQCNQSGGNGYGFTEKGAASSDVFRGSYTPITTYSKPRQCGGKRRRKKSKKRRKSKKGGKRKRSRRRRKSRKSRKSRRRRKSKKGGRRKRRRTKRRTGTLNTLANPPLRGGSTVSYGAGFPKSTSWALGPVSIKANEPNCFDNYSHGKK